MGDCLITKILFNKHAVKPTKIKFQNGELLNGVESELSCGLYVPHDKMKEQRVTPALASETGLIYSGEVSSNNVYNMFIAIRNKSSHKTRLIAIDEAMLKPIVPQRREILDSRKMEVNKTAISDLNKEFGSKKIKRVTDQLERYKMNVDNFKEDLEQTVAHIEVKASDLSAAVQQSEYLPPINVHAITANAVYTLNKLVPANIIESLKTPAQSLLEDDSEELKLSDYTRKRVEALRNSNSENAVECVTQLLILDALINIYSTSAKSIALRTYQATVYSHLLNTYIVESFTVKTGKTRTRPFSMKDKATMYIIVICLLIGDMKVNLKEMSSFLNVGVKKVQQLARVLRLHVKDNMATISLPLPAASTTPQKTKSKGRK